MSSRRTTLVMIALLIALAAWFAGSSASPPSDPAGEDAQPAVVRQQPTDTGTPTRGRTGTLLDTGPERQAATPRRLLVEVVGEDGTAVPGVRVSLARVDELFERTLPRRSTTDAAGVAEIDLTGTRADEEWTLSTAGPRARSVPWRPASSAEEDERVRIILLDDVRVSGRVLVRDSPPLAGAAIIVALLRRASATGMTDADGHFDVAVPGEALQRARKLSVAFEVQVLGPSGTRRGSLRVPAEGPTSGLEIVLDRVCTIVGRCVDAGGNPVPGARLTVGVGPGHAAHGSESGRDGRFVLEVAPGTWAVMAKAEGKELWVRRDVDCTPLRVDVGTLHLEKERTCRVRGRIVDRAGKPVVGAKITTGVGPATRLASHGRAPTTTDASNWRRVPARGSSWWTDGPGPRRSSSA